MTFWLIIGINWSINFWFCRVAQTTCDNWTTVSSCTSEQGGGSELDASLLGCSGVVGLEFNLEKGWWYVIWTKWIWSFIVIFRSSHIEKIQSAHHVINLQREEIDKQNTIIQTLQDKLDKVEERVEEQEQYSRRTNLRFNNILSLFPLSFFLLLKTIARCLVG
jgi:hypothetical protein